jgi:hypothetical protein
MTLSPLHCNELCECIVTDATAASNQLSTIHSHETHQHSSQAKKRERKVELQEEVLITRVLNVAIVHMS